MPKKPNYTLKAGAIIHPQGTSKFYSLNRIPDEVAEEWLGKFPADINKFETYPADWESRVTARKEGKVAEPTIEELKAEVERLNEVVNSKDIEIEQLKANVPIADGADAIEVETLKADLAEANETIEKCKAEAQNEVCELNATIEGQKVTIEELKAEVERLKGEVEASKKKTTKKASAATEAPAEAAAE